VHHPAKANTILRIPYSPILVGHLQSHIAKFHHFR